LEANLGLDRAPLDAFAELGFSGDVWAVPEGRVVVAGGPLLEVTTPIAQARLVETALLNEVTFQTAATSNVQAARRFGLPVAGTMAHSFIEAFEDDRAAFRAFAGEFPDRATFLVDTYDTLGGVRAAIEVIGQLGLRERLGIRIDSGDLAEQAIADWSPVGRPSTPTASVPKWGPRLTLPTWTPPTSWSPTAGDR
jgi:nicotinate phosphoribosyltransferase